MRPARGGSDRLTVLAFAGIVLIGGSNAVAVRLGNAELSPFFAAAARFAMASILLLAVAAVRGLPLPAGRTRVGIVLYGLTSFAGSFAGLYRGLVDAPAPTAMVALATVPVLTLLMATAIGQEAFSAGAVVGAVVALGGVVLIVNDQLNASIPPAALVSVFAGAAFVALSSVIVKQIPPGHPVMANGFGMAIGAVALAILSLVVGEPWVVPRGAATWASLTYLTVIGSVGLFMLLLYVLARWSASATSYATLAMPLVTVGLAAILLDETVSPLFVAGAAIALVGVYIGVAARQPRLGRTGIRADIRAIVGRSATPGAAAGPVASGGAAAALAAGEVDCRPPGC